jgi:protein RecA
MSKLDDLCDALDAAIGANADNQAVTQFIDTGFPELNYAISGKYDGGLPFGRMCEMFGESSSGKTALATDWMSRAQQAGGVAGFVDWERSFSVDLATQGFDLNDKRPHWIYGKPRTWEEGNVFAAKACQAIRKSGAIADDAPILFVFDSIAAALPKSQAEKEIDEYTMNDTTALARVTSTTLKAMAQHCEEMNATFLYLNQIRLKPGVVYGDPRTTPGGKAMEYYSTARIALGRQKIMEAVAGGKEFVGQNITAQVTKSKLTKPFKEANMRMTFDEAGVARFDREFSTIDFLKDKGTLPYSKPYVTWIDGKKYHVKALAQHIRATGQQAELLKFLPAAPIAAAA